MEVFNEVDERVNTQGVAFYKMWLSYVNVTFYKMWLTLKNKMHERKANPCMFDRNK